MQTFAHRGADVDVPQEGAQFPGTLLCDVTMTIGSVLVFLMVRRFGVKFVELFVPHEKLERLPVPSNTEQVQSVLFFIFLIPGTPKDMVTYLAGLTELPLLNWALICFVGGTAICIALKKALKL